MPRKPAPKPDDPAQHKRFIDMAREVEVDEREGTLDRAFERIRCNVIEKPIKSNPQDKT
jgi:hypothetical protein